VIEFETESEVPCEVLRRLDGVREAVSERGVYRLTVDQVHRVVPELLVTIDRSGAGLTRLATHHATLEDVFVALTGRHLRNE
jgi:ABC-2 type transport system ATP-binding protein